VQYIEHIFQHLVRVQFIIVIGAMAKLALLVLRSVGLCFGAKPNVPMCGWLKLFLKKCGGKKNKKHRVDLSVGLFAVPLEYGLYVGHLSNGLFLF
jgi:hypothetical protein